MNLVAKMALKQLISYMNEKNISELKVFINSQNEIDFVPVHWPDSLMLKSEHDKKINELKEYFKTLSNIK